MKRYLARLAARITPLPQTAAGAPIPAADPFETVNGADPPGSPPVFSAIESESRVETSKTPAPPSEPSTLFSAPAPPSPRSIAPAVREEAEVSRADDTREKSPDPLRPTSPPQFPSTDPILSRTYSRPAETPEQKIAPPVAVAQPMTPAASDLPPLVPETANEKTLSSRVEGVEETQAMLLRKADAFMQALTGHTDSDSESDPREPPPEAAMAHSLRPAQNDEPRIERRRVTVPPPQPIEETPSVVIGRLTVEITPPERPGRTPSPQRSITVRNRAGATVGIPSSRRFGLSQF
jgi:hypothetical protein